MKNQLKIKKKWTQSNIKISRTLRDIIHGYIMSDGYINRDGALQVDQSKKQEKFVEWIMTKDLFLSKLSVSVKV